MKRYLCILFLLFGCFIFGRDYASASGVARLVKVVYYGASDFSTAYAYDATASVQPYKYGAKELDRTHGLDLYDFTICEGVFDTLNDTNKVDTKIILQ